MVGMKKKTGSKPAPGGPGSAFNEIVSGELVLILEKYPDMTEDELAALFSQKIWKYCIR